MAQSHGRSKRTKTGAKRKKKRDKIKAELGREPVLTTVGETDKKHIRTRGGNPKTSLRKAKEANVLDPGTGKIQKTEIVSVLENTANRHYVRRNIITKGAVIETKLGKARVTSRPTQDGLVNAILVKD
ncbi:MAG: 30S ribosomal protein S8e [Candidatus Diapherotrites archaeon]|nr:30S ribosomal protein S8e [Candidatus Diapherotrites archaeon]